eukprot:359132-Chlamydomonas_euryale.AAC.2
MPRAQQTRACYIRMPCVGGCLLMLVHIRTHGEGNGNSDIVLIMCWWMAPSCSRTCSAATSAAWPSSRRCRAASSPDRAATSSANCALASCRCATSLSCASAASSRAAATRSVAAAAAAASARAACSPRRESASCCCSAAALARKCSDVAVATLSCNATSLSSLPAPSSASSAAARCAAAFAAAWAAGMGAPCMPPCACATSPCVAPCSRAATAAALPPSRTPDPIAGAAVAAAAPQWSDDGIVAGCGAACAGCSRPVTPRALCSAPGCAGGRPGDCERDRRRSDCSANSFWNSLTGDVVGEGEPDIDATAPEEGPAACIPPVKVLTDGGGLGGARRAQQPRGMNGDMLRVHGRGQCVGCALAMAHDQRRRGRRCDIR